MSGPDGRPPGRRPAEELSPRQRKLLELMLRDRDRAPEGGAAERGSIPRRPPGAAAVLSFAQRRIWFVQQLQPGSGAYNIPSGVRLHGPLDAALFGRALAATAARHETLRSTFALAGDRPVQVVAARFAVALPVADLQALPAARREAEAHRVVNQLARLPFVLAAAPPWRAVLVRIGAEDHVFLAVMHHIISDTWTTGVFFREMTAHYRALIEGRPARVPKLPIQYGDYAHWQSRELEQESGLMQRQLAYWQERFAGAPELLALPTDRPRPAVSAMRGGRSTLALSNTLTDRLKSLAADADATLFMVLMAAYQTLLLRHTGQEDVLVGTPMANRTRVELENLIGVFVNTLVLRTGFAGNPSFRAVLKQVREATLAGLSHHDVPFEKLVEVLQLPRDTSRNPLFQVLFAFQNVPIPKLVAEGLTLERFEFAETTARLDVDLDLQEMPYGFVGWIGYNSELFDAATMERWARAFLVLLEGLAARPDLPVWELPLLGPGERHQLETAWNDTRTGFAAGDLLHRLFERQAERTPEALAVTGGAGGPLTYAGLERRANQLANLLRAQGVGPGTRVAVHLARGPEAVVAVFAILKAGGTYVPLETSWPPARCAQIVELAGIVHAVSERARRAVLESLAPRLAHLVLLDRSDWAAEPEVAADLSGVPSAAAMAAMAPTAATVAAADPAAAAGALSTADAVAAAGACRVWTAADADAASAARPRVAVPAESPAYALFTSGSTGIPKGVVVGHRPVVNLVEWVNRTFAVGPADRLLWVTALSFDLSVYDLFGTLAAGATLRIASEAEMRDPQALAAILLGEPITFWDSAPAALQQVAALLPGVPCRQPLRLVFQSGDWIPVALPDKVRATFPAARVIGLGGPTETVVWTNCYPIGEVPAWWPSIPYGRPIQNVRFHVLDAQLGRVPIGVQGDLHVSGECLSLGYLGDPELTARKFLPDPFAEEPGGRLYNTGDRVRHLADGTLEFQGRLDHQVKIRGFRIELGEVEAVLARHPAVKELALLIRDDTPAGPRLVAYVVPRPGQAPALPALPAVSELRGFLRERLPEYMVPAAFVLLDALPVTANGKLDRRALPAPDGGRPEAGAGFAVPEGETEDRIAALWRQVLGVERIGRNDNFFDLGGHSLLLSQVHRELQQTAPELTLVDMFTYPTVGSLAGFLSARGTRPGVAEAARERAAARRAGAAGAASAAGDAAAPPSDIAIIGMGLRFPGAATPDEFWRNLAGGVESISFFSREEVLAAGVSAASADHPDYVRAEGDIRDVELFEPELFGLTNQAEVEMLDPQQRILMECAWEALESAGYDPASYAGVIGMYGGVNISSYLFSNLYDYDPMNVMSSFLTRIGILVGNQSDYACTRIAYHFNLRGPSISVQTACSTATVAAHLAYQSLLRGECDMCLAGGAQIRVPQGMGYLYQEGGFPSPDGHCRSFDARAKGNVHGNGAGVVLLKRLADAQRDGDHVYAVIKGSAACNDGSVKVGYTAPGVDGQVRAAAEALVMAGVEPGSVGYLEATGAATELGDPIEIEALSRAYRTPAAAPGRCAIGSVKTNIGHLDVASGAAALIKCALVLERELIPPSLHFESPNPRIDFASSPFFVNTEARPWRRGGEPRRAAVHTYAVGGTNTHLVLEEAPEPAPASASRPWQLLPLAARTSTALHRSADNLAAYLRGGLSGGAAAELADVAFTLKVGRRAWSARRAVLCRDGAEAAAALAGLDPERVWSGLCPDERRQVALLLPGGSGAEGSGADGALGAISAMAAAAGELYAAEPTFREELDCCAELLLPALGTDLRPLLGCGTPRGEGAMGDAGDARGTGGARALGGADALGGAGSTRTSSGGARVSASQLSGTTVAGGSVAGSPAAGGALADPRLAEPARFAFVHALARLWLEWGVKPAAVAGWGAGELVGACLAGVLSLADAASLAVARGRALAACPPGSRLEIEAAEESLAPLLGGGVAVEAVLGPRRCRVAGDEAAVTALQERLNEEGIDCLHLGEGGAGRSTAWLPAAAREAYRQALAAVTFHPPAMALWASAAGAPLGREEAAGTAAWERQLAAPARLGALLDGLLANPQLLVLALGSEQDVEDAGPAAAGADAVLPALGGAAPSAQARLLAALGRLWVAGVDPDWAGFYRHERRLRVPLPTYPFERRKIWAEPTLGRDQAIWSGGRREAAAGERRPVAEWFHALSWRRSEQPAPAPGAAAAALPAGTCLILADAAGLGDRLAERLRGLGRDVAVVRPGRRFEQDPAAGYRLDPRRFDDFARLLADLAAAGRRPTVAVHLWGLAAPMAPAPADTAGATEATGALKAVGIVEATGVPDAMSGDPLPPGGPAWTLASFSPHPMPAGDDGHGGSLSSVIDDLGFWSLHHLGRALGESAGGEVRLEVVAAGTQEVTGEEELRPAAAACLSACLVIPREYPEVRCRSIDVVLPPPGDGGARRRRLERLAGQLLGELARSPEEPVVAYRGGHRWVQASERLRLDGAAASSDASTFAFARAAASSNVAASSNGSAAGSNGAATRSHGAASSDDGAAAKPNGAASPGRLRQRGVYVVAGGLQGFGLLVAGHLARTVQARLALVGDTGLPARESWDDWLAASAAMAATAPATAAGGESDETVRALREIRAWEALGAEVLVADADLADAGQVRAALKQVRARFGAIHGVFYAAAEVGEELARRIVDLDRDFLDYRLRARLGGLRALAAALPAGNGHDEETPDFVLLAGTVASVVGGPAVAADCCADVFLDLFARQQDRRGATAWTSVDWDAFQPPGAAAAGSGATSGGGTTAGSGREVPEGATAKATEATGFGTLEGAGHTATGEPRSATAKAAAAETAALAITATEGAEAFSHLLSLPALPQVIVSTVDLAERLAAVRAKDAGAGAAAQRPAREARERPPLKTSYVGPRSEVETQVAGIWAEVLGMREVGVEDDFFDLGGNSLLATQLVSRLRGALQINLALQDFFSGATVAAVAERVQATHWPLRAWAQDAAAAQGPQEMGEI